jgi:hypothetical protein
VVVELVETTSRPPPGFSLLGRLVELLSRPLPDWIGRLRRAFPCPWAETSEGKSTRITNTRRSPGDTRLHAAAAAEEIAVIVQRPKSSAAFSFPQDVQHHRISSRLGELPRPRVGIIRTSWRLRHEIPVTR